MSWRAGERVGFVVGVLLLFAAVVLAVSGSFVAAGVAVVVGFGTLVAVQLSRVRRLGRMRHNRRTGSIGSPGNGGTGLP